VTRRNIFLYTHKTAFICDCVHMVEEYVLASDCVWLSNALTVIHYNYTVLCLSVSATFDFEQQRISPSSATYENDNSGFFKYQTIIKQPTLILYWTLMLNLEVFTALEQRILFFLGCDALLCNWFVTFWSNAGALSLDISIIQWNGVISQNRILKYFLQ